MITTIRTDKRLYQIGNQVAETPNCRIYLCSQEGEKRQFLLQIATDVKHNAILQRGAYILKLLDERAVELEADFAKTKTDPNVMLNYQLGFPELVDSFVCQEQGGRQVNVTAFRNVENVSDMVPLVNLTMRDRLRVDFRTSAWIMGKPLKLLAFTDGAGVSPDLRNNIVIYPAQHYAVIFDWTVAQIHSGAVPLEIRRKQISQLAKAVIVALGGDLETGVFPDNEDGNFTTYVNYLMQLAHGGETNAKRAHEVFYGLVDSLWPREFYPFTVKPLR